MRTSAVKPFVGRRVVVRAGTIALGSGGTLDAVRVTRTALLLAGRTGTRAVPLRSIRSIAAFPDEEGTR